MQIHDSTRVPRRCVVCQHPDVADIEARLRKSQTRSVLAAEFSIGRFSVTRHAKEHMVPSPRLSRSAGRKRRFRNSIRVNGDDTVSLKLLPFKRGLWTTMDQADLAVAVRHTWHLARRAGLARTDYVAMADVWFAGRRRVIALHRLLTEAPRGLVVDHINGNPLDNRRANIRVVTQADNMQNRRHADRRNLTGVRGVHRLNRPGRSYWQGQVIVRGQHYRRRFPFTDEGLAAAAAWVRAKRREVMPYSAADQG